MGIFFTKDKASERGNIATILFGSVAMVGVVTATTMQLITGPIKTASEVNNKNMAETQIQLGMNVLVAASADSDADTKKEPPEYDSSFTALSGGGAIPSSVGAAKVDPWNTQYGYCVWDHGATDGGKNDAGTGTDDRLQGPTDDDTQVVFALISAGPDRTFQHSCDAYDGSGTEGVIEDTTPNDDIVLSYAYDAASSSLGGLWSIGTDTDEVVVKDAADAETVRVDRETGTLFVRDLVGIKGGSSNQLYIDAAGGVGIGETNPAFSLDIAGASVPIRINSTNSNAFKLAWSDNGTTRGFLGAGNGVPLYVGSSAAAILMTVLENGNVGIGTTTPAAKLDIRPIVYGNNQDGGIEMAATTGQWPSGMYIRSNGSGVPRLGFDIDSTEVISIVDGGNVGIGTASPGSLLTINGSANSASAAFEGGTALLRIQGANAAWSEPALDFAEQTNTAIARIAASNTGSAAGDLHILTRAAAGSLTTKMTIKDSGNVGIGTAGPQTPLHVIGDLRVDGAGGAVSFMSRDGTGTSYALYNPTGDDLRVWASAIGDRAIFYNNGNFWIQGSMTAIGNHIINNTSPTIYFQDTDHRSGMIHMNGHLMYFLSGGGTNSLGWAINGSYWPMTINMVTDQIDIGGALILREGELHMTNQLINSNAGVIRDANGGWVRTYGDTGWFNGSYGGGWYMTDTTWVRAYNSKSVWTPGTMQADGAMRTANLYLTSDRRYKKNIEPLGSSLDKISKLIGVSYEWDKDKEKTKKAVDGKKLGFIAQDVEKIYPELVSNEDDYKSLDYTGLIAPMVESIKELKAQNDALQARIEILEAKEK